jgi:hypothetical protein
MKKLMLLSPRQAAVESETGGGLIASRRWEMPPEKMQPSGRLISQFTERLILKAGCPRWGRDRLT